MPFGHNPDMLISRFVALLLLAACHGAMAQQSSTVYRCPGPPVLYTDALSAKEAQDKGCRTIEGTPITVLQSPKPRPPSSPAAVGGGSDGNRIDANQQRSRDAERRRVLDTELREAEARLAVAQGEYAGGNAERQGSESRNYQKYLDRMANLKASVNRQESDIQALKREISKLP